MKDERGRALAFWPLGHLEGKMVDGQAGAKVAAMKAVMTKVPQDILYWRRRTGADRWDEMWDGVLHMPPAPNRAHQRLQFLLERWLDQHWAEPHGHRVYHDVNLSAPDGWPNDYRIPDLVLLGRDRLSIDRNEYFEGAPTAVVEIQGEDDEAFEKLDFYARLGVPEVWIVNRDTRAPELLLLAEGVYRSQGPSQAGWLLSPATGVELKCSDGKLAIRLKDDPTSEARLPDD